MPRAPRKDLNLNVRGLDDSATIAVNDLSRRLEAQGRLVHKLGLGQSPFPVPEPVVAALRAHAHEKDYLPTAGLPALREAVAGYLGRRHGVEREAEGVLVGPGSKELMFLLQLVFYGELVIPSPSWVSYAPQARIVGRTVTWLPTRAADGWKLSPDDLACRFAEDRERPRLFVLNYPNNPTGQTYSDAELRALAEVAREHRVLLLSDEIYGELHHAGAHRSVARYYPEGTIVSTGLSKWAGAGGWRLGVFAFPPELGWLRRAMVAVASETYTSVSAPIQYAAVRAFTGGPEIADYLHRACRILGVLGRHAADRLAAAGLDVAPPQGGFYLFPDFEPFRERLAGRGVHTSDHLAQRLLVEAGVAVLPGREFGRPPEELTVRLAYVDFDGAAALSAATRRELDAAFLADHAPSVLAAVDAIADWLGSGG